MTSIAGDGADPFARLGLPRTARVDGAAVRDAWRQRSRALHPDRIDDPVARAEAAAELALVNEARAILEDDERRLNLLLELAGGPSASEEKTLPDGFLQEILLVRMEMEEALAGGDPDERERFERWAQEARAERRERVVALLAEAPGPEPLRSARIELNAWRYLERMIEQLGSR